MIRPEVCSVFNFGDFVVRVYCDVDGVENNVVSRLDVKNVDPETLEKYQGIDRLLIDADAFKKLMAVHWASVLAR